MSSSFQDFPLSRPNWEHVSDVAGIQAQDLTLPSISTALFPPCLSKSLSPSLSGHHTCWLGQPYICHRVPQTAPPNQPQRRSRPQVSSQMGARTSAAFSGRLYRGSPALPPALGCLVAEVGSVLMLNIVVTLLPSVSSALQGALRTEAGFCLYPP